MDVSGIFDLPSRDDPYDPDMTVQEALELGLVAVLDTQTVGRTYNGPCGAPAEHQTLQDFGVYCTRNKGHKGVHAFVQRWSMTWKDAKALEAARKEAERERMAKFHDRAAEQSKKLVELQEKARQIQESHIKATEADVALSVKESFDSMAKALAKLEARSHSAVYGPGQAKNARFKDSGRGKVRGK